MCFPNLSHLQERRVQNPGINKSKGFESPIHIIFHQKNWQWLDSNLDSPQSLNLNHSNHIGLDKNLSDLLHLSHSCELHQVYFLPNIGVSTISRSSIKSLNSFISLSLLIHLFLSSIALTSLKSPLMHQGLRKRVLRLVMTSHKFLLLTLSLCAYTLAITQSSW